MPLATTWMNLQGMLLSEVSQTEKDKYHMISLIYMWNIKNKTKQTKNNTEIKLVVAREEVRGNMSEIDEGDSEVQNPSYKIYKSQR